jgi:hypothetical protein
MRIRVMGAYKSNISIATIAELGMPVASRRPIEGYEHQFSKGKKPVHDLLKCRERLRATVKRETRAVRMATRILIDLGLEGRRS